MNNCGNCGTETRNKKYCSKSCAATVNNTTPKRVKKVYSCEVCCIVVSDRRRYCDEHDPRCKGIG